jgi:hypothetical protein
MGGVALTQRRSWSDYFGLGAIWCPRLVLITSPSSNAFTADIGRASAHAASNCALASSSVATFP